MIFNSYSNSALQLANRVVMAPMTRCRADHADAVPDELHRYSRQRASVNLTILEGVPVPGAIKSRRWRYGAWMQGRVRPSP